MVGRPANLPQERYRCNPVLLASASFPMAILRSPFCSSSDLRLRLLGPLVLFAVVAIFFRLRLYIDTPRSKWAILIPVAITCGYIGWELSRLMALFIQYKLPGLERIRQRLIFLILSIILLSHFGFILRT